MTDTKKPTTAISLLSDDIFSVREAFGAASSNHSLNFEAEAGFALQQLTKNDWNLKIAMGNRQAVIDAVTNVAAIGVSLNPARKQAYLVPRKNAICLDLSYMGLIDLAVEDGGIMWAQAEIVRANDSFKLRARDQEPIHERDPFASDEERGAIRGAYVVVKTSAGDFLTHTMKIDDIYAIRDRSDAWKSREAKIAKGEQPGPIPWVTDESEMIKKTVVKQAYKYWPKGTKGDRFQRAIHMLNETGEGVHEAAVDRPSTPAQSAPELTPYTDNEFDVLLPGWVSAHLGNPDVVSVEKLIGKAKTKKKSVTAEQEKKLRAAIAKSRGVTDVTPKGEAPATSYESVEAALRNAKDEDELNNAADLISQVTDAAKQAVLNTYYDTRLQSLRS